MNIGWWQGGVHIEPESEKDRLALVAISEALGFDKSLHDGSEALFDFFCNFSDSDVSDSSQGNN